MPGQRLRVGSRSDLAMAEDVQDPAVGLAHEEATNAPRFIGKRVDYLAAHLLSCGISLVDVVDFDRDIRVDHRCCSSDAPVGWFPGRIPTRSRATSCAILEGSSSFPAGRFRA